MVRVGYHSGFPMIKWIDHSAWHLDTRQACSIYIYIFISLPLGNLPIKLRCHCHVGVVFVDKSGWYKISNKSKTTEFGAGADSESEEDKGWAPEYGRVAVHSTIEGRMLELWCLHARKDFRDSIEITGSSKPFQVWGRFLSMIQDRDHIPESDIVEVVQFLWGEFMYVLWVPGKC